MLFQFVARATSGNTLLQKSSLTQSAPSYRNFTLVPTFYVSVDSSAAFLLSESDASRFEQSVSGQRKAREALKLALGAMSKMARASVLTSRSLLSTMTTSLDALIFTVRRFRGSSCTLRPSELSSSQRLPSQLRSRYTCLLLRDLSAWSREEF